MSLLEVSNIGKAYRQYSSEWQRFASWFGVPVNPAKETWVLKNINFSIEPGEAIGIVGQNGAGKSTLLKIITGTTQPTEGQVSINGRVSAILELGMGFNQDLTGRQNVYHSAGLLGYSYQQIHEAIPEIEAFAEIGKYFDEPVRTYSSGMQMRVAFSVATAWRPEILIIDEALSVGDSYFQHKSFSKIREYRESGTSLLIVSHGKESIQSLCDRAILLEEGKLLKDSNPELVFDFYNALIAGKSKSSIRINTTSDGRSQVVSGTGEARVQEISLCNKRSEPVEIVGVSENVFLQVKVGVVQDIESLVLGFSIKDRLGQTMYGTNTWYTKQIIENASSGEQYIFRISFDVNFGPGSYSVQLALVDRESHLTKNYEWIDIALVFDVVNKDKPHFIGSMWNESKITIEVQ